MSYFKKGSAVYFTYKEMYNGVYKSQVIDVVQALRNSGEEIRLFSIISVRQFFKNYRIIKKYDRSAIILPSFAPLRFRYLDSFWLLLYRFSLKNKTIFCRGVFSTNLAIKVLGESKVIYDGRGAVFAEHNEYEVFKGTSVEKKLFDIEKSALLNSYGQIAVSHKLVNYWKKQYEFKAKNYKVIPCTVSDVNTEFIPNFIESYLIENKNKILLTFIGGNGRWQGIDNLINFLRVQFKFNHNICAVLLTSKSESLLSFQKEFPERVLITKVKPTQVYPIISKCDYGMLLRDSNITNRVSSPVKIAEYLRAGLKILISKDVGDYSQTIEENNLGLVINDKYEDVNLIKMNEVEKNKQIEFSKQNYDKYSKSILDKYKSFI